MDLVTIRSLTRRLHVDFARVNSCFLFPHRGIRHYVALTSPTVNS
jgi:hypothetical protein